MHPLNARFMLRIVAPTVAISLLLFGLGVAAAWNVQRQQERSSELVALEVHNMVAAQELVLAIPELRHLLQQSLRGDDRQALRRAVEQRVPIEEKLHRIHELSLADDGQENVRRLAQGLTGFFSDLEKVERVETREERQTALERLLDHELEEQILQPARNIVLANGEAVDRTNIANRHTTDQMRQAFLLLGICGGAGGLIAGLVIARGIGRSMIRLDISVRGAADKLKEVIGPVQISTVDGFPDLERGLQQMENHITTVVEKLQIRERESLRNQQLAAVGQLAAGLAHELRNPLMPMKMLVQKALLREDGTMPRRQLQVLDEEIKRLELLVQEFLDFARPQSLQKKPVDLHAILTQALELVAARARVQEVELSEFRGNRLLISGDPLRLRQVLLNLLLNSLDEQPHGGRIDISVKELPNLIPYGPCVVIQISDRGPGVSDEIMERIFEPFVSTKETGTGLGLSICKRIMEDHGGTLLVKNRDGGGAVFEMVIPRSAPPDATFESESQLGTCDEASAAGNR
ncbi:sensor histidine kinase [Planctomicrobium sp. SH664]|uniref:sensor histidine kinase n=1 Tax=Planctomicrobium sp. SH664 TaxID=3448125 RepID=UPI003F5C65DE